MMTRSESEMMDLIRNYSEADDRIRLVIINGSRANPNIKKDIFQDYDIACYVTDVKPYLKEDDVVPYFGETIIYEQPNIGPWPPSDADGSYHNYNMQFVDGNRIDLSFFHLDKTDQMKKDSLSKVLIDKDGICKHLEDPSEESYYISQPTTEKYKGCCNAFFFAIGSHIPKNIWRRQIPQLKSLLDGWLRVPLHLMLSWEIGIKKGFNKTIGAGCRHLPHLLDEDRWSLYLETYVDADIDKIWHAIFVFYELFIESAQLVAKEYDFVFPEESANKVLTFLKHVKNLPNDAESIY